MTTKLPFGQKRRRGRPLTQPTVGHPALLELFRLIAASGRTVRSVAAEVGIHEKTIAYWANPWGPGGRRAVPSLAMIDDCLQALGYRLAVVAAEPRPARKTPRRR